jgi:hypothetical protein
LFGFKDFGTEPLKCIEMATGKEVWSQPGMGQGGCILVDGHVLVQGDQGQLVLAEATPKGYKESGRFAAFKAKCWSMPVVANGRIYTRSSNNPQEGNCEAVCLEVK